MKRIRFASSTSALKAKQLLLSHGISSRISRVSNGIDSCGYILDICPECREEALQLIKENGIKFGVESDEQ